MKTPVVKVVKVSEHPNADRLELIEISIGKTLVSQKGLYKKGDLVVWIQPGATVSPKIREFSDFEKPMTIKTRTIRGVTSHGYLVPARSNFIEGQDVGPILEVTPHRLSDLKEITELINVRLKNFGRPDLRTPDNSNNSIKDVCHQGDKVFVRFNKDASYQDLKILSEIFESEKIDRYPPIDDKGCPSCCYGYCQAWVIYL